MVHVITEIEIRCTAEKVSAFASDPDNAPEWYVNIHSAEWMTAKSLIIGSLIAFKAKFLGGNSRMFMKLLNSFQVKEWS